MVIFVSKDNSSRTIVVGVVILIVCQGIGTLAQGQVVAFVNVQFRVGIATRSTVVLSPLAPPVPVKNSESHNRTVFGYRGIPTRKRKKREAGSGRPEI